VKWDVPQPFVDERGRIQDLLIGRDLLIGKEIDAVTLITTNDKCIRGNHYHEHTHQWTLVTKGVLRIVTQNPGDSRRTILLHEGGISWSPPGERHAWQAVGDATCVVFVQGPRAGEDYESDVIRLEGSERLIVP
jgi:quercetin dioxygenase-like cupin family protein